jgi:hypothetical protein
MAAFCPQKNKANLPASSREFETSRKGWPSHETRNPKLVDSKEKNAKQSQTKPILRLRSGQAKAYPATARPKTDKSGYAYGFAGT